jgi:Phosphodiester glycosidase
METTCRPITAGMCGAAAWRLQTFDAGISMVFFRLRHAVLQGRPRHLLALIVLTAAVAVAAISPGASAAVTVSRTCGPAQTIAPGVAFRHCTARLSNLRSTQQVYMILWKQGDARIRLAAQPLGVQGPDGSIPITTISRWATWTSRPGLAAALNGDYFTYTASGSAAYASGLVVHAGKVLDFAGASDEQQAGYAPGGRVVIGTPRAVPARLLLPTGASLTVGAWGTNAGHRDQVGVIHRAGPYTPPAGYEAVALAADPFRQVLSGNRILRNRHGVDRPEHVIRFVLNDASQPDVTTHVAVTFPAAPGGPVTVPAGGVGLVFRNIGTAHDGFVAISRQASPGVTVTQPDAAWARVTEVMSGKPVLVKNGAAVTAKPANTTADQWYAEQWRPAVATRNDGKAMMLVAGSSTGSSTTGAQFGRLLVAFNARNAIQFDNRSSTELYRPRLHNGTCTYAGACYTQWNWERDIPLATMLYSHS